MDIILLEKIQNLGRLGDKVSVKAGYWRNYLLPQNKALLATPANIAEFEARRVELERIAAEKTAQAQARADSVHEANITIVARASDEGKLYGSLTERDIVEAIHAATGVMIEKSEVQLSEGPIRSLGEYEIKLQFHSDVVSSVKLKVVDQTQEASS
jgi:large subunit ribosomal protein L9